MFTKRKVLFTLSLLGLFAAPALADDKSDCSSRSNNASLAVCDRLIASGKFQGERLAKIYHHRAVFWRSMGGDLDKAIADDTEAIRLSPKLAVAFSSRGLSLWQKGDFDRALADGNAAIALDPNDGKAYNRRGLALRSKGDSYSAVKDFDQAIRRVPGIALFHNNRGNALRDVGLTLKAEADFTKAIALDPKDPFPYANRGSIFRQSGEYDRALADFNKALALNPENGPALAGRGQTYLILGQSDKAQADFKAALKTRSPYFTDNKWVHDVARQKLASIESMPSASASPAVELAKQPALAAVTAGSRRIALVIGNSAYKNAPVLPNPQRDAALVADTLKRTGFAVTLQNDLDREALVRTLRDFAKQAESADWALVYYAGHGMEVAGVNYLLPVDAKVAVDRDIGFEGVPLDQVLNAAERAKMLRLVILDACRDNPLSNQMRRTMTVASRSVSRGLAAVEPEPGTLVVYAAKDGETALDGDGKNSPFTMAFVKNMETPGLEVRRLFDFVRDDVMESTKRKQKPFSYGSISGRQDFYFVAAK